MRVGIVGNYGNDNLGDDAILEGIIIQLEDTYNITRNEILVFSNNPAQTREKYGVHAEPLFQRKKSDIMKLIATVLHNRPIIKKLDLLIIGGGGILMDLYRNAPIVYGMYGWLARRTKTPAIIYGAGAGPIQSGLGKFLLRSLGNSVSVVTVRDMESKKLLESIGVRKQIDVISDPAFFVRPAETRPKQVRGGMQIGVTAVPYYHNSYWPVHDAEKYHNYISGMATGLDHLLEAHPEASVNFFSTKHPYDTDVTKEICGLMTHRERTTVCDEALTHEEVISFIQNQDIIIGTRLHSVILGIVSEKPILAISYHPKVQDVLDSIGCSDFVISIEDLHKQPDFFMDQFTKMNQDWDLVRTQFKHILHDVKTKSPSGMDLLKDIYPPVD